MTRVLIDYSDFRREPRFASLRLKYFAVLSIVLNNNHPKLNFKVFNRSVFTMYIERKKPFRKATGQNSLLANETVDTSSKSPLSIGLFQVLPLTMSYIATCPGMSSVHQFRAVEHRTPIMKDKFYTHWPNLFSTNYCNFTLHLNCEI